MRYVLLYLIGLIFGIGITVSGMSDAAKVLNFFDFAGNWDPSLALVMGAALITAMLGYRLVLRRPAPTFEPEFTLPGTRQIDLSLVGGSAVFGIGWGITGLCPGGALPALGTGHPGVWIFTISLVLGIFAARVLQSTRRRRLRGAAA